MAVIISPGVTAYKAGSYNNLAEARQASVGYGPGSGSSGSSSVDNFSSAVNNLASAVKSGTSYGDLARSLFNYSENNSAFG